MATIGRRCGLIRTGDRIADIDRVQTAHGTDIPRPDFVGPFLGDALVLVQLDHLLLRVIALLVDHGDRLGLGEFAREDLADGHAPDVIGVLQRGHEHLQGLIRIGLRGRNIADDRLVDRFHVAVRLRQIHRRPTFLGRGVNHGEIQRVIVRFELDEQIEHLVDHILRPGIGAVYLVDHQDGFEPVLQGLGQHEPRLRHRPVERIDDQQHAVGHLEHPLDLAAKIGVARRIDDIDLVPPAVAVAVLDGAVLAEDRDAALPFERIGVHDQAVVAAGHLIQLFLPEHARLVQKLVHQRRLAVVYMGDNRHVAYCFCEHTLYYPSIPIRSTPERAERRSLKFQVFLLNTSHFKLPTLFL